MRGTLLDHAPRVRPPKPLVVRAGLGRTFGSLIAFLALLFLGSGAYILQEALTHPREAHEVSVIAAAFAIALAALLLFYLLKPRRIAGMTPHGHGFSADEAQAFPKVPGATARSRDLRKDLAYQRIYVDHSRIRP